MTSEAFLRAILLTLVSDDYEGFCYIESRLEEFVISTGKKWSRTEIEGGLRDLVEEGLVCPFLLSGQQPTALQVSLQSKPISELWFYATKCGREAAKGIDELKLSLDC